MEAKALNTVDGRNARQPILFILQIDWVCRWRCPNLTDLYEIKESVDSIAFQLDGCGISLDGIFNNADAAFDARSFRQVLDKYGIIAHVCPNTRNGVTCFYWKSFEILCTLINFKSPKDDPRT